MKYRIQITERLRKIIDVEAEDREEALRVIMRMYQNEEIVLSADDYHGTNFKFIEE